MYIEFISNLQNACKDISCKIYFSIRKKEIYGPIISIKSKYLLILILILKKRVSILAILGRSGDHITCSRAT